MIGKMELYGLKSSGAAFRSKLAGVVHDLSYVPLKADPDVCIRPAVRPNGSEYYEMALCYVDGVLVIAAEPMKTMDGIRAVSKLKGDKAKNPDMYLGASSPFSLNTNLIPSIFFIGSSAITRTLSM